LLAVTVADPLHTPKQLAFVCDCVALKGTKALALAITISPFGVVATGDTLKEPNDMVPPVPDEFDIPVPTHCRT
jgi:hypothetical protein